MTMTITYKKQGLTPTTNRDNMYNKLIGKCEWCNQDYCQECTNFSGWERFCSRECEADQLKDNEDSDMYNNQKTH